MTTTRLLPLSKPRRRPAAIAALATALLLPALLSACSPTSTGSPDAGSSTSNDAATVGQCVRDRGYQVDDSFFSSPGSYRQPAGLDADQADAYAEAVGACAEGTSLAAPSGSGGFGRENDQQLLDLAACLRDAGFTDAQDPVDGVWFSDPAYEGDPAYETAAQTCQAEVGLQSSGG